MSGEVALHLLFKLDGSKVSTAHQAHTMTISHVLKSLPVLANSRRRWLATTILQGNKEPHPGGE